MSPDQARLLQLLVDFSSDMKCLLTDPFSYSPLESPISLLSSSLAKPYASESSMSFADKIEFILSIEASVLRRSPRVLTAP
jgi:hypothetical protein